VESQVRHHFQQAASRVNHGPVPDAPQKSQGGIPLSSEEFIAGSPAEVAEQILGQCGAIGAGHFLAMLDNHGGVQENRAAFDLFGREVIPLLRRAGASSSRSVRAAAVRN